MATLLRRVHRWRFEIPLALVLGAAAGFAASVMPTDLFQRVPVIGRLGLAGQAGLALGLGLLFGWLGYTVMRPPAPPATTDESEDEAIEEEASERLHRFRRADFHPDAPPRAPIRAHRDLGEPFMEVNAFGWPADAHADTQPEAEVEAANIAIPEADFVELPEEVDIIETVLATQTPVEPVPLAPSAPLDAEMEAVVMPAEAQAASSVTMSPRTVDISTLQPVSPPTPRAERQSLTEMMDRLSAGLERRVREAERGAPPLPPHQPPRDMRPALRDALEELNRLAARRS